MGSYPLENMPEFYAQAGLTCPPERPELLAKNIKKLSTLGQNAFIFLVGLAHKKGKGKELGEFRRINNQTLVNLLSKLDEKNKLPERIIFAPHQTRITIHRFNNRKININNSE